MDKTVSYPLVFKRIIDFFVSVFFPKDGHTIDFSTSREYSMTCCIVASLHNSVCCCFALLRFITTRQHEISCGILFSFKAFSTKQQKSQRKNKSIQRYRAQRIKRQLCGKYHKMFVSENDRSKWPARREFDWSSPRSGRTLSVDRPLFWALTYSSVLFSLILAILHQLLGSVSWVK